LASSRPKPWESGLLYRLIGGFIPARHKPIDQPPSGKAALQGNGAVAVPLYQALKEAVTQDQDFLSAMQRLTQPQQLYAFPHPADHPVNGGIETIS